MVEHSSSRRIRGDAPITTEAEDALGRLPLATQFAEQLLAFDAQNGLVTGILGPWGSGKTSFLNLLTTELERQGVESIAFNPWIFSGADQLVDAFFVELSSQLKLKPGLAEVGDTLAAYGEAMAGFGWIPLIGAWIERGRLLSGLVASALKRHRQGTSAQRHALEAALARLERPIVITLDDVDRLTTPEIRDIFKLVRLTASFNNLIYILAFDRLRVEQALEEANVPGRAYLEKILELALDLPTIPETVLNRQIFSALDAALDGVEGLGELGPSWPDVYMEVVRPLIRNLRDVRRYAAAVYGTARALAGEIALVDILALEAIRIFLPDVFALMPVAVPGLTTPSGGFSYSGRAEPPELRNQIESLVGAAGSQEDVVRSLISRLFPAAQRHIGGSGYDASWQRRWLRGHRVAHEANLRLWLERTAGGTLEAFRAAEGAWQLMRDAAALDAYLRALDPTALEEVIGSLEAYEDEFTDENVQPSVTVLLNLLPDIPDRERGFFDLDARLVVGRVVYRLIRLLEPAQLETTVDAILPDLTSLRAKFELITDVGYRENAGHKLVSEAAAKRLERQWRDEVRAAEPSALAREDGLLWLLRFAKRDSTPEEPEIVLPDDAAVDLAVLKSARSDVRSASPGNRAIHREPRLAWEELVDLYGGEDVLVARLENIREAAGTELMTLVERYASGWRPPDWGDEGRDLPTIS